MDSIHDLYDSLFSLLKDGTASSIKLDKESCRVYLSLSEENFIEVNFKAETLKLHLIKNYTTKEKANKVFDSLYLPFHLFQTQYRWKVKTRLDCVNFMEQMELKF